MPTIKKNLCLLIACLFICIFNSAGQDARAVDWQEYKISEKEKVVFAFYNVRHKQPDYDFWITTGTKFDEVPVKLRERYLIDETLRLGQGYNQYDIDTETINIDAPVMMRYSSAQEGSDEKPVLSFRFLGANDTYIPAFDFSLGRDTIALIANKIGLFSDLKLSEGQDALISEKIPQKDAIFSAKLQIRLRPTYINNSRTQRKSEGGMYWVLISEIAYIRCELETIGDEEAVILWDYVAPWYQNEFDALNLAKTDQQAPHPYDLYKK